MPTGVESRPLLRQVYETLRARILQRELRPGERLHLSRLAQSLGVSVTPVRDAVNLLAAEGLVMVSPRRGTIITPVSKADVHELYQIRLMLEPPAADIAAQALSDAELRALSELVDRLETHRGAGADDISAYMRDLATDGDFHAGIVRGVRNQRLDAIYKSLQAHVIVARALFPHQHHDMAQRHGEHRRILEALRIRDGRSASEAITEHLQIAEADVLKHLPDPPGAAGQDT